MRAAFVVTAMIPIKRISAHPEARKVDVGAVKALADSIAEIGFINPLRVRQLRDAWQVIAGGHRLAAARMLGFENVPCLVVDDDDLHAELAMIDENLCRNDLSPSERAEATARRKEIYIELHRKTKRGATLKRGDQLPSRQVGETGAERFSAATAKATNLSERVIQRDVERAEKIVPDVLDKIAGTPLDTGVYLDRMKATPPEQQRARVLEDLSAPKAPVPQRRLPDDAQYERLVRAWEKRPSMSSSGFSSVTSGATECRYECQRQFQPTSCPRPGNQGRA